MAQGGGVVYCKRLEDLFSDDIIITGGTDIMISKCSCNNASQDKIHGKGMRVMNACGSAQDPRVRCTVCKREYKSTGDNVPRRSK